jgi:hypothetical protein
VRRMSTRVLRSIPTLVWASVALVGFPLARAADAPLIVVDSSWNRNLAKQLCSLPGFRAGLPPDVAANCPIDPLAGYLQYEIELITQFASATKCKGIRILTHVPEDRRKSHWGLIIYYQPGEQSAHWDLVAPYERKGDPFYLQGTGDQQKIADDVCTIVTEQGAKLN